MDEETILTEEIQRFISKELAEGFSSQEIIDSLVSEHKYSKDDAISMLKAFYENWQNVIEATHIEPTDHLNWHIWMRHKALQLALTHDNAGHALSILDSLAKLQQVTNLQDERLIPIQIVLSPKLEPDKESEDG